jgi:hypothetical protein
MRAHSFEWRNVRSETPVSAIKRVIETMEKTTTRTTIIILDTCRDNPCVLHAYIKD